MKFRLAELYRRLSISCITERRTIPGISWCVSLHFSFKPDFLASTEEIEVLAAQVAQIMQDKGVDSEELPSICKEE